MMDDDQIGYPDEEEEIGFDEDDDLEFLEDDDESDEEEPF